MIRAGGVSEHALHLYYSEFDLFNGLIERTSERSGIETAILAAKQELAASDHVTETVARIILLLPDVFVFRCKYFLSHRARIGGRKSCQRSTTSHRYQW